MKCMYLIIKGIKSLECVRVGSIVLKGTALKMKWTNVLVDTFVRNES